MVETVRNEPVGAVGQELGRVGGQWQLGSCKLNTVFPHSPLLVGGWKEGYSFESRSS